MNGISDLDRVRSCQAESDAADKEDGKRACARSATTP